MSLIPYPYSSTSAALDQEIKKKKTLQPFRLFLKGESAKGEELIVSFYSSSSFMNRRENTGIW